MCLPTKRQDWRHSFPTTPTYYKASRMLNHHTHPTDPIRDKKTYAFDTSMASPSRRHNFTVRVSHRYIITAAECGCPTIDRVWALPPWSTLGCSFKVFEFRRSHQQWRSDPFLLGDTIMDNEYRSYTYMYIQVVWWLVFRRCICPFGPFQILWCIIH